MGKKHKRQSAETADRAARTAGSAGSKKTQEASSGSGKRRATTYDSFRENVEAIVTAIVLAVIIRHFAIEAFEIPTGSMAPSLYGIHAWTHCPNCRTKYNVALRTDRQTNNAVQVDFRPTRVYEGQCGNSGCAKELHYFGTQAREVMCDGCDTRFAPPRGGTVREAAVKAFDARCPICTFGYRELIEDTNYYGGHKILVTKFSYVIDDPRRWDVIVFAFDQWKNYIKRLVGLPGEMIDIWDGDIYVNGEIERKYRHPYIQDALWVKISDSDVAESQLRGHPLAWHERAPEDSGRRDGAAKLVQWNEAAKSWSVNALGEVAVMEYTRGFDNFYSYNQVDRHGVSPHGAQVGDKKVELEIQALPSRPHPTRRQLGQPWVGAEIRDGDFTFQVRIPVGKPDPKRPAVLERMENHNREQPNPLRSEYRADPQRVTAPIALPLNKAARIAFENVDDRVAIYVRLDNQPIDEDDEPVLAIEYTSLPVGAELGRHLKMPAYDRGHSLDLVVVDSQVRLSHITVFRDMYYISEWDRLPRGSGRIASSRQLGDNEYFALGDNGPSSSDSRFWGVVPHDNLMGKGFSVFWPALPWNFQCKFIR